MKSRDERHFFFLFLHGGAGSRRPAAVKGAPYFKARRERTLDGEDRGECIVWGGKGRTSDEAKSLLQGRKI
jgi:hypothetical protein